MRKPHLFTSEEPWPWHLWGTQMMADCGEEVHCAKAVALWDTDEPNAMDFGAYGLCRKCLKAAKPGHYIHIIREGQSALDAEITA